jgi:hypothetical protein
MLSSALQFVKNNIWECAASKLVIQHDLSIFPAFSYCLLYF